MSLQGLGAMGSVCNPAGSYPGDPAWSLMAFLNPACWFSSGSQSAPVPITAPGNINEAVCGSGTAAQQASCQAGVVAAQSQASSDPSYCCAASDYPNLCALGLTSDNCGVSSTGLLMLAALGLGAFVLAGGLRR